MWRLELPWVEKYRPSGLDDVLGHEDVVKTIRNLITKGQLPHILLHGPPGTGKTSLVQAIARSLYGQNLKKMVLELNASDDRGIATVRTRVKTFAETRPPVFSTPKMSFKSSGASADSKLMDVENEPASNGRLGQQTLDTFFGGSSTRTSSKKLKSSPVFSGKQASPPESKAKEEFMSSSAVNSGLKTLKLVVLDEVDQMTAAAQTALRRIMEKYAGNVRFFLMCNDVGKINPPIQSRCTKFRFMPLPETFIIEKLQLVVESEGLQVTSAATKVLLSHAKGDFRRLLNVLQATSLTFPDRQITDTEVLKILGLPSDAAMQQLMLELCTEQGFAARVDSINTMINTQGYGLHDILTGLYSRLVRLDLPNEAAISILPKLAEIEENLCSGCPDRTQVPALVSIFVELRLGLQRGNRNFNMLSGYYDAQMSD
eukprot:Gregarina_sp_Poly_1__1365@NODE_1339_length_4349_cov_94_459131_g721_i1_p2_GENE_NODE_1339_length_4349_cov_94_459131_g721_i1NODE_1339_length_4349_cov_94_459131_g721_i1_p2_ORF_typecomplete_len429_score56_26DNA_pol3_delta2/PF13177_6/1_5e29RuvB_N/PF05496_12/1_2e12RuvB_N/PF05496_12/0_71AAA/PF00004_29/3_7e15Rad17/PF03215_15/1_8e13Rep_fac_C/PF08542_11/8_8e13AAA_22/PF13401_6/6_8e09AAA_5/PF07728_14/1_2e06AAA_5/PF07728_14/12AAA_16/PF13191_6/3e08Bac_DnaA/PF00308_18/0_00051Bac_DnaA/PF00308_18/0_088AAA_30/PF13